MKKWLLLFLLSLYGCVCDSDAVEVDVMPPKIQPLGGIGIGPKIGPQLGTGPRSSSWTMHTMTSVAACDGADGVHTADYDLDGDMDVVTACEQANNKIIVNRNEGDGTFTSIALPNPLVGGTISGTEDAEFGDINGDGLPDVVIAEAAGRAARWYLNNGEFDNTPFNPPNMIIDGTFLWKHCLVHAPGVVFCAGYSFTPEVARFDCDAAPCLESSTWTHTKLTDAGDVRGIAMHNGDDLLVFDYTGGTTRGIRWIFDASVGTGSSTSRIVNQINTLRGHKVGSLVLHVIGSSDQVSPGQQINILDATTGAVITSTIVPTNFGRLQTALFADINNDAMLDIVLTASHASPDPLCVIESCDTGVSSVVALLAPTYTTQIDISGPRGIKHDNAIVLNLVGSSCPDVLTTEEKYLGIIVYENPMTGCFVLFLPIFGLRRMRRWACQN